MTAADWIDDLERKAKAATPGPWSVDGYGSGQQVTGATGTIFADTLALHENAEFIAAANPATILRLIETLRQERVCYTDECGEPCRSHVALLWAERDTARKKAGLIGQRLGKVRAELDALAAKVAAVEAELQQQRHRTAEFQTIAAGFANRAVAAEEKLAAVEALHRVDPNSGHNPDCPCGRPAYDGQRCSHCRLPWPCPTSAALAAPTDTTKETP